MKSPRIAGRFAIRAAASKSYVAYTPIGPRGRYYNYYYYYYYYYYQQQRQQRRSSERRGRPLPPSSSFPPPAPSAVAFRRKEDPKDGAPPSSGRFAWRLLPFGRRCCSRHRAATVAAAAVAVAVTFAARRGIAERRENFAPSPITDGVGAADGAKDGELLPTVER